MPKKGWKKPRPEVGDPGDPQGMVVMLGAFLNHLRVKNYQKRSLEAREQHIYHLIAWCDERGIARPSEVTKPILKRYQLHLLYKRKRNGHPMSPQTQTCYLTSIRMFFKWLSQEDLIPWNPASELELPKVGFHLPHGVLSISEVEQILNSVDISKRLGIRDRAILEVLYSTGIRRQEAAGLEVQDIKSERGVVVVRQGKGQKERVVPIGERALKWVEKYLYEERPGLLPSSGEPTLFLNDHGNRFSPHNLGGLVKKRIKQAEIDVDGACHVFRHTMATLMLENGADIRYIQEMLGHAKLETTQIYTRVSIERLKEVHTATHPAKARREKTEDKRTTSERLDELNTPAHPLQSPVI